MERELTILTAVVREAGQRALEVSAGGLEVSTKPDHTPVTSADLEVNRILHSRLTSAFPGDAWLSEETPDALSRLEAKRVWIVDPIDGTKYLIDGIPEFAISVALIEAGEPQIGAIFNPATDELFMAVRGRGATLNDAPIRVAAEPRDRFVVFGPPPAMRRGRLRALETVVDLQPMGSVAYTLGLVAAGRADAAINMGRMKEWDVAAGVLLIEEGGGFVCDSRGAGVRFNTPDLAVEGIIAGRPETAKRYASWLAALASTGAPETP